MYDDNDIIAARATPAGKSALAVIRMSGEGVRSVLRRCLPDFQGEIIARRATLANFGEAGTIIDSVIFIYYRGPKSYTGEDLVEIHCHGGEYIAERTLALLCEKGARPAKPGEFTCRAFMNGKMDLTKAEAVSDLIAAESDRARRNALNQLHGGLQRRITEARNILLNVITELEVELEFPEDEPFEADYWGWGQRIDQVVKMVKEMIQTGEAGKAVREGFRVVIAGPPNSGKSTLLNALLGEDRAIVHPQAGTTRDILRESTEIKGIKIWLTDTAGLRKAAAEDIESEGIDRAYKAIQSADLVIYLFDLGVDDASEHEIRSPKLLLVGNKVDLYPEVKSECDLRISALRGDGLEELRDEMVRDAVPAGLEGGVISNERHLNLLNKSLDCLLRGREIVSREGETELISLELRDSAKNLGEITGEGVTEEVLERIFSNFCIGK